MIRTLGIQWIITLFLFLGFLVGIYYVYDTTNAAAQQRQYEACLSQVTARDGNWKVRSQMAFCHDLYKGTKTASLGRYGASPDATISLAMIRRPDFRMFNSR